MIMKYHKAMGGINYQKTRNDSNPIRIFFTSFHSNGISLETATLVREISLETKISYYDEYFVLIDMEGSDETVAYQPT